MVFFAKLKILTIIKVFISWSIIILMGEAIDSRALDRYRELINSLGKFSNLLKYALEDKSSLSFGFLNITNAVLSLAPQEINEETGLPNYYISGSLAMNLLSSINKITLDDGQIIKFDDNHRKMFEICYRKIHDLDFISTDNNVTVHNIAYKNSKHTINGKTIEWKLKDLGLSIDSINKIFKNCINCSSWAFTLDSSMDEQQENGKRALNIHFCKATIKSQKGDFDVFITDPRYLLGYKFAAYLKSNNDKDKSDFLNLYKGLSMIFGEKELECVCMKYKELRPDLFN